MGKTNVVHVHINIFHMSQKLKCDVKGVKVIYVRYDTGEKILHCGNDEKPIWSWFENV